MNFIVEVEGKEYGPIDQETLRKWVEHGRVETTTKVRNALIMKWYIAGDLDILKDVFERVEEAERGKRSKFGGLFGGAKEEQPKKVESTAFKYRYLPCPAPFSLRVASFIFDGGLLGALALIFLSLAPAMTGSISPNASFYVFFFFFCVAVLIYYGGCLGVFAQTLGMWFWGLMIARNDQEATPAYIFRAYIFTILMIVFGVLSPLVIYLNGKRRALHEILSGTSVIRIAAKPKT